MASLVKEATQAFGDAVLVKKVITKKIEGAKRYQEIIKQEKCLIPIPSLVINNQLIFRTIPAKEKLVDFLNTLVHP